MGVRETEGEQQSKPSLRALVVPSRQGQEGSVLLLVLTVVLMLSIAVAAILNMSLNSDTVAVKLEQSTRGAHRIDSAMEKAVNDVRGEPSRCGGPPTYYGDFNVECVGPTVLGSPQRDVKLIATDPGSSEVRGIATVRFTDRENGQDRPGFSVEICDWLVASNTNEPLQGCPA